MTTKTISGTYAAGYTMMSPVTVLSITTSGYVEGSGVKSPTAGLDAYTVVNAGRINASGIGVYLYSGGSLTNGSASLKTAQISGGIGVIFGEAAGEVSNFATIKGVGVSNGGADGNGVILSQGGAVTNGSNADTTALISGAAAVTIYGRAGTLQNFGTLNGTASLTGGKVVYLDDGGSVTNGSATDTSAYIGGYGQSYINALRAERAAATVTNFGIMYGASSDTYNAAYDILEFHLSTAVDLADGGKVTNGSTKDTGASIGGAYGVLVSSAAGTVVNDGTIRGAFYASLYVPPSQYQQGFTEYYTPGIGVDLQDGGSVTNGTTTDTKADIYGFYGGVSVKKAAGTVRNFGTIQAVGYKFATGIYLGDGGSVTNGAAGDATALIEGLISGVYLKGAGVVTNYGLIESAGGGSAIVFSSSADKLVVEAGSAFIGGIYGDGGTLDLASGQGSIARISAPDIYGNYISVRGSLPNETFVNFGTLEVASGTQITLDGIGTIIAGAVSTADLLGTLIVTGSLANGGAITGAGTLSLAGGQTTFGTGTSLTVATVTVSGATTQAVVATTLTYAGDWDQSGGTTSVAAGDKLTFKGAGDSFSGTLSGSGAVLFSGGADAFTGLTLSAISQSINGAAVTLSGVITLGATLSVTTPNLTVAAAGVSLTGGGTLSLTNSASNSLHGISALAKLINVNDRIVGAGQLGGGGMVLTNDAAGVIEGDFANALILNTGSKLIQNLGLIEATAAGAVIIQSSLQNTGTLYALGEITVNDAVSGAGVVKISGGTADFTSTFTQNVTFTGVGGLLELAKSQSYTGQITGFSKTGLSSLDLGDITFGASTKATFSGNATSGVLTVTDGTHTAKITLVGNYATSTFTAASDGHGGTKVTDPPAPAPAVAQAMASFAPAAGQAPDHVIGSTSAHAQLMLFERGRLHLT